MFEFLNPTFLTIAAGAAAIPILIHLLRRNKAVRVPFSAMRFLLGSSRPVIRWLRLKQFLILIMRIAAVALLGLAFARPFLPSTSGLPLWSNGQEEIAVIIDQSASIQAANNFAATQKLLNGLFAKMKPGTPVSIYLSGGNSGFIAERQPFSRALVARTRAQLQKTFASGNLRQALQAVDDVLMGSPALQRHIYIISDFQKASWPADESHLILSSNAELHLLPTAARPWQNIGIVDVKLPSRDDESWACSLRNFSGKRIQNVEVRLLAGEKILAKKKADVGAGQIKVVTFTNVPIGNSSPGGFFQVVAKADQYSPDNRFYFSLQHKRKINILAVNGEHFGNENDELFYLKRAFAVAGSPFNLVERRPNGVAALDPRAFDVVLLANVKGLNHKSIQALRDFLQAGGGLGIALGDQIDPAIFNQLFSKIAPAKVIKLARPRVDRSIGDNIFMVNPKHPIFAPLSDMGGEVFNSTYIYQHWLVSANASADVLARFSESSPAILTENIGQGKVVMLTFPVDAEWSEWPIKTSYLPLLYNICGYLNSSANKHFQFWVDQPIFLGNKFNAEKPISVKKPNGREIVLQPGGTIFSDTDLPGIYQFRQGNFTRFFVANASPSESQPEIIRREQFLSRLDRSDETTTVDRGRPIARLTAREAESQQKLWRLMLGGAFLLLLGESFLANRTPR